MSDRDWITLHRTVHVEDVENIQPCDFVADMYLVRYRSLATGAWFTGLISAQDLGPVLFPAERS